MPPTAFQLVKPKVMRAFNAHIHPHIQTYRHTENSRKRFLRPQNAIDIRTLMHHYYGVKRPITQSHTAF